jgi:3-hydroxy acid dehydrogenase/malonic semialdehyde reductase
MSGVEQAPDIPQDVIQVVWATNVTGTHEMTQAVLRIFKECSVEWRGDIII